MSLFSQSTIASFLTGKQDEKRNKAVKERELASMFDTYYRATVIRWDPGLFQLMFDTSWEGFYEIMSKRYGVAMPQNAWFDEDKLIFEKIQAVLIAIEAYAAKTVI